MEEKRFKVYQGHLRWNWPDSFEIEVGLTITNSGAFREFLNGFNARNPEMVERASLTPNNPYIDEYVSLLIEEYLGA